MATPVASSLALFPPALRMLEVFAIRLAAGFAAALLCLPTGVVEPRFYRLHLTIAVCFLAAAAVFAWQHPHDAFWLPFSLGFFCLLAGAWSWSFAEYAFARLPTTALGLAALLASLILLRGWDRPLADQGSDFLDDLSAALLLGHTVTAMLLGHWYLIAPNLSIEPLLRLQRWLFASLGLRAVAVGLSLGLALAAGRSLDQPAWLWLAPRVLAGLVGAAGLTWMAWQSARLHATQSATGILYVVTVFVFIGELTDQLLRQHLLGESM
ncbi:MAG TPA: hypothetical protein PKD86_08310 [Gemmatales bacterium]|nr:hypothetical protein [Gemmatales bacterium]